MLQRVLDERERRVAAERAHKAVSTPLAVQQETNELKEALRLEVLARQEAEAKAARLQRSTAALESQYRIASETAQRLQRQHRGSSAAGGGAAGAGGPGSSSSAWK
jgi:phage I-like protein